MKYIYVCLAFLALFFYNCNRNEKINKANYKVIPYKIIYKEPIIVDIDTFYMGVVVFKKEMFKNKERYLNIDKSATIITKQNNFIYVEFYMPYIKNKIVLDTVTLLNSRIKINLGWYLGKMDFLKYNKDWKDKLSFKDFKIGNNLNKRLVKIGRR